MEVHMNRFTHRKVLAGATAVLAAIGTLGAVAAPAHADLGVTPVAPCTPTELPTLGYGGGLIWVTDSGLYVGAVGTSTTLAAAYWMHDTAGYHVHVLPNNPLVDSEVLDSNETGRMIELGTDPVTGDGVAAVYDLPSNSWWRLPSLGGTFTEGRRINATGEVAGASFDSHGNHYATTWSPPYRQVNKLPAAGAPQSAVIDGQRITFGSFATGINNAGTASGVSDIGAHFPDVQDFARQNRLHGSVLPLSSPTVWAPNGAPQKFPAPYAQGIVWDLNDAGLAVGSAADAQFNSRAAYWQQGTYHDMGAQADVADGTARGLSQGGWATGQLDLTNGTTRPLLWTGAGSLQQLPLPSDPRVTEANAHGVSDTLRQVAGSAFDDAGTVNEPVVWQCPAGFTTG
jgi:hypothetical protein